MERPGDKGPEPEGGRAAERLREFRKLHVTGDPNGPNQNESALPTDSNESGIEAPSEVDDPSKL